MLNSYGLLSNTQLWLQCISTFPKYYDPTNIRKGLLLTFNTI